MARPGWKLGGGSAGWAPCMVYRAGGGGGTPPCTPGGCMQPGTTQHAPWHALGCGPWVPCMLWGPARGLTSSSIYRLQGHGGGGGGGPGRVVPSSYITQAPLVGPGQQEYGTRLGEKLRAEPHACIPLTTTWCMRVIGVSLASSYSFDQLGTSGRSRVARLGLAAGRRAHVWVLGGCEVPSM